MARKPFEPLREDGRPRWRVIFDMAVAAKPGDTISYLDMMRELDTPDRKVIYRTVHKANEHLWASEQRTLDVIPDVGYRVLLPEEHMGMATGFKKQARRKIENAVSVMQATDLAGLPNAKARDRVLQFTAGLILMARTVDRHERQLARHDDMIAELGERVSKMEEERGKKDDDKT